MSIPLEDFAALLRQDLQALSAIEPTDDGVRVTTHCMYPSNGLIRVTLRPGRETVVASDEGEAVGEALSAGVSLRSPDRTLRHLVRQQGLDIYNGVIVTPRMPIKSSALAVMLVANTAKETAQWLYEHQKLRRDRDFGKLLAAFLKKTFDDRVAPTVIVGASNKPHKFAHVVSLPENRKLVIDPVRNESSSINARVVAHLDVKSPNLVQRLVYDDDEDWSAADLNLLNVGALAIPFSRSSSVIERVASENRVP